MRPGIVFADEADAADEPAPLVATTVKVYSIPSVNPVTTTDVPVVVAVILPGFEVTVYEVIVFPPLDAGADHDTVTCPTSGTKVVIVGAPGTVYGVTEEDAVDALELPALLVAITVNVYGVPLLNPVTVALVPDEVAVILPGLDVTVYKVIAFPPLELGADHDTATCVSPLVPDTPVGALGTVYGVTEEDAADALEFPAPFLATTVNV